MDYIVNKDKLLEENKVTMKSEEKENTQNNEVSKVIEHTWIYSWN